MQRQIEVSLNHNRLMKNFDILCKIVAVVIIIMAFGVGIWCFSLISEQREACDNFVLVGSGVVVPVLTLFLTLDFKTPTSKT